MSAYPQPPMGAMETASRFNAAYRTDAEATLPQHIGPKCAVCSKTKYTMTNMGRVQVGPESGGCGCQPKTKPGDPRAMFRSTSDRLATATEANTAALNESNAIWRGLFEVLKATAESMGAKVEHIEIPEATTPLKVVSADLELTGNPAVDGPRQKAALLAQMA